MRYSLKPLTAALAVVVALLAPQLAPSTALAQQSGSEQYSGGDAVTVDFELQVEGEVPGWQYFHVEQRGGGGPGELALCTTHTERLGPMCESGGTYSASAEVPAGEPVSFDFVRDGDPGPSETFASGSRTFTQDTTVRASYDFHELGQPGPEPTAPSDNAGDQYAGEDPPASQNDTEGSDELPPLLPDTGGLPLLLFGAGLIATGAGLALLSRKLL